MVYLNAQCALGSYGLTRSVLAFLPQKDLEVNINHR